MELIDSHCHLDFEAFNHDRNAVIESARSKGIKQIVVPGVSRSQWPQVRDTCAQDGQIHACFGLHPYMTPQHREDDINQLNYWLQKNECVAVGECGLDYRKDQADKQLQLKYFIAQIEMAQSIDKPIVVHSVRATEDVIKSIRKHPGLRGMVHSYSGSFEQALQLVDMGFYISFGGSITYDRARKLRATASKLPLESILLETDAPDQPDAIHNNERNEPAYLINVLACLSQLRDESIGEIASQTTNNSKKLFGI